MERILIVDDNNDICLLLERFLSKQGYKTASVQRGEDGLALLRKDTYELVICDFKLPDIDGLEMLRRIKVLYPATAVIIITGYSDVRVAVQSVKHGAYDYVTKPLYPDEICIPLKVRSIGGYSHWLSPPPLKELPPPLKQVVPPEISHWPPMVNGLFLVRAARPSNFRSISI